MSKSKPKLCMIMLTDDFQPKESQLQDSLMNELSKYGGIEKLSFNKEIWEFIGKGFRGYGTFMPGPIPWGDLEGPCATSLFWENAETEVKNHRFHIVLTIFPDELSDIAAALILTQSTRAFLKTTDSIGVYWGAGTLVQKGEHFIELSEDIGPDNLPLYLWIDFRVNRVSERGYSFFTTGMSQFGLMEIEIDKTVWSPNEIREFMYNISHYLIENGPVINDGDTIGGDENERIVVQFGDSMWEKDERVYKIKM